MLNYYYVRCMAGFGVRGVMLDIGVILVRLVAYSFSLRKLTFDRYLM